MIKNELSQLYFLNREIEQIIKRMSTLNFRIKVVKNYAKNQPIDEIEKELSKLTDILVTQQKKCFEQQEQMENFINGIESSEMRMILAYRYINGLSWQQVAFSIGEHDESYVRKKHDAYLKKIKQKNGNKISVFS